MAMDPSPIPIHKFHLVLCLNLLKIDSIDPCEAFLCIEHCQLHITTQNHEKYPALASVFKVLKYFVTLVLSCLSSLILFVISNTLAEFPMFEYVFTIRSHNSFSVSKNIYVCPTSGSIEFINHDMIMEILESYVSNLGSTSIGAVVDLFKWSIFPLPRIYNFAD